MSGKAANAAHHCPGCGDEHGGRRCREYAVQVASVGYAPPLFRSERLTARSADEARAIVAGWGAGDLGPDGWYFVVGPPDRPGFRSLADLPGQPPPPDKWRVTNVADYTPTGGRGR